MDHTMDQFVLHYFDNNDNLIIALQMNSYLIHVLKSQKKLGGSTVGRITINQNQLQGNFQLFSDYLSDNPVYPAFMFCRRFRMQVSLFQRITEDIVGFDEYFLQKRDAAGRLGFSPSQKITLALRMMAYGCSADSIDEYTRMSKSSSHFLAFVLKKYLLFYFFLR
jgi:hypothetical protein